MMNKNQTGLSMTDYIRLYNMNVQEVHDLIKISHYFRDQKRLDAINRLGLSNDLEGKYVIKDEQTFQDKIVIPQLKKQGHEIKDPPLTRSKHLFCPIIGIFSTFKGKDYFTEVKIKVTLSSLQIAIGQLTMHYFIQEYLKVYNNRKNVYQIAYPIYYKDRKAFSSQLFQFLKEDRLIEVIFF